MRKYIHAYYIDGRGTVGIDVDSWSGDELSGNKPFVISHTNTLSGYTNITSIKNFERFCDSTTHSHRIQIEYLFDETTWEDLDSEEKRIVAKYFLVDKDKRDEVFDYKKELDGRLHPEYIFDSIGWLIECNYYRNLNIWQDTQGFTQYEYSDPILKYEASYQMKDDGYVGSRTITRRWYRLDGTLDTDSKVSVKYYEPMSAREESKRRRQNLINKLIIQTVGLIIMTSNDLDNVTDAETDAMEFMKYVAPGISEYYEYGNKKDAQNNPVKLVQLVMDSDYSRLDNFVPGTNNTVTIRQFIISNLDI
jgi:hypothetical protein